MKNIWNVAVKRGADGSKHLDLQVHGFIDDTWTGDDGVAVDAAIADLNQHLDAKTIGVRINSVGGSAFGGVALYNALQSHPADVTCVVEGLAASAASLIAMAGKCVMGVGSMLMIHSPLSIAMGNATQLRKEADMLDKVQDSLAGIYTAKTGKSMDEINDLLDEETWMSAEEAVAAGFADQVGTGDAEPDSEDPNEDDEEEEGDDEEEDTTAAPPQMVGDMINWRGASYPVARVPQQIVAMAITTSAPEPVVLPAPVVAEPVKSKPRARARAPRATAPALKVVPTPAPPPALTRAEIELRAPEILLAAKTEGHAAGVAEERARLMAIDELGVTGCADMLVAAKYGETPTDATTLAVAIVKAGKQAGAELLARRRVESRALAAVTVGAPDHTATSEEARHIHNMVAGGNGRRGEKK